MKENRDKTNREKILEMLPKGMKVLSPEEHKKLVEGKEIVFSPQAIEDAKRIIREVWDKWLTNIYKVGMMGREKL